MRRGDVVTVALPGDLGKPRPAIVLISDLLADAGTRVVVLPLTTTIQAAPLLRVTIQPAAANGLRQPSQVMVDRMTTISRDKIGATIGRLEPQEVLECTRRLLALIGVD